MFLFLFMLQNKSYLPLVSLFYIRVMWNWHDFERIGYLIGVCWSQSKIMIKTDMDSFTVLMGANFPWHVKTKEKREF